METVDTLTLAPTLYANKRIAFRLICDDGEPYSVLTCNIVEAEIEDDEICIPSWNLPEDLLAGYLATGKFVDTGKGATTGYVVAPIWRVVCPQLLTEIARLRESAQEETVVSKKQLAPLRRVVDRKQSATRNNTSMAGTLFLECGHRVRVTGWDAFHAGSKRCKECLAAECKVDG